MIAAIIAAKLLLSRESWVIGSELPGRAVMRGYGFLMGLASSLMGISGGSLVTMLLTLYRKTIHQAVATASGIGVPITIAGTFGYALAGLPHQALLPPFSIGFVSVIGVVMIAPISSYVAPIEKVGSTNRRWKDGFLRDYTLPEAAARFQWGR